MTDTAAEQKPIDLPTQIACARRELDMRRHVYPHHIERKKLSPAKAAAEIAAMEAVIKTLEWLAANEAKIKAKVDTANSVGTIATLSTVSSRVYRQRVKLFLDFPAGGWSRLYDIIDDADRVIGTMEVGVETRRSKERREFVPVGFRTFDTSAEFIAAYERGEWKAKEVAPG